MRNPILICLVTAVLCVMLNGCSRNQAEKHIPTVAIVSISPNFDPFVRGVQDGMESLGYRPGETIKYLYDGPIKITELDKRLSYLKTQNIDLLFTMTTPVTLKAKEYFSDTAVPIIFAPVFSPVDAGLVDSISNTGGNITGVMTRGSTAKALDYLLDMLPSIKTIFVPYHYQDTAARLTVEDLNNAAAVFGIEIVTAEINDLADLKKVLQNIPDRADALWLTHSHLIVSNAAMIVEAAMGYNMPVASSASQGEKGALVSYGVKSSSLTRKACRLANKILRGVPASQLPVERAEYYLSLNLRSAQRLGISIPQRMLQQADTIVRPDSEIREENVLLPTESER